MVSPVASISLLIGSDVHHFVFTVQSLKSLGKGSFWGRGQRVRLNTLVDVIRVPKVRTSGE